MQLTAGTLIAANVRLSRPLASGAMGTVWVAEHLTLATEVAVKVMAEELAEEPSVRARFEREAAAAAQLATPHVVRVFDRGTTADGAPYIVMELVEGESLRRRMARGRSSLDETAEVVTQLARALGDAHAAGIVHRDLKPDNVLLVETDGELLVKLADFGVAKWVSAPRGAHPGITRPGTLMGTPLYMAAEQLADANSADPHADLWSLAVVAYEMLTGELPFMADNVARLLAAIVHGAYTAPSRLVRELGPDVDAWFARAFAAEPEDRFASARQMAAALARAAARARLAKTLKRGARAVPAPRPTPPSLLPTVVTLPARAEREVRPPWRALAAALAACLALLVAVGARPAHSAAIARPALGSVALSAAATVPAPAVGSDRPEAHPAPAGGSERVRETAPERAAPATSRRARHAGARAARPTATDPIAPDALGF
jgi:serine/threonine-protein kinase